MKKLFLFALLSVFLFSSCEKDPDEITVTINESGALNVKVIDNDKNNIENANINIYSTDYNATLLYEGITNKDGIYSTGKLLQGNYYCYATAKKNGLTYSDSKTIQIIANETKNIEINPFSNSGSLSLTIRSYYDDSPISNVSVYLTSRKYDPWYIEETMNLSIMRGKTDANGFIQFTDIPVDSYNYTVLAYNEATGYHNSSYVYIYRGEGSKTNLYMSN